MTTKESIVEKEYMKFRLTDMGHDELYKTLERLNGYKDGSLLLFLQEVEGAELDYGKLYTIIIAMKGYSKEDKELDLVMIRIIDRYKKLLGKQRRFGMGVQMPVINKPIIDITA